MLATSQIQPTLCTSSAVLCPEILQKDIACGLAWYLATPSRPDHQRSALHWLPASSKSMFRLLRRCLTTTSTCKFIARTASECVAPPVQFERMGLGYFSSQLLASNPSLAQGPSLRHPRTCDSLAESSFTRHGALNGKFMLPQALRYSTATEGVVPVEEPSDSSRPPRPPRPNKNRNHLRRMLQRQQESKETHWRRRRETAAKIKLRDEERRKRWRARHQFTEQMQARARREEKRKQAREARDAAVAA